MFHDTKQVVLESPYLFPKVKLIFQFILQSGMDDMRESDHVCG